MRLTEELPMGSYRAKTIYLEPNRNEQECIYKLGQLEDAEELCELIRSNPIFIKTEWGIILEKDYTNSVILYDFQKKSIEIYDYELMESLLVDEFGKTWAFTKEVLG